MKNEIPPAFMAMPRDCGRGAHPVFNGVKCVDMVICHFYCTKQCQVYFDHVKAQKAEKKERKEEALKAVSKKPKRQALETAAFV